VTEAWLAAGDEPPLRISEDGSGATSLALGPRTEGLLALMVDARTALTAMHARTVAYEGRVRLGEDVVVFVGGPGDRSTRAVLAIPPGGPGWALLPIARDVGSFGLAAVRLEESPRVDEPVVWSMYPNGLDPAPIATVARAQTAWVGRVRPEGAEPGSARTLELGTIEPEGAFVFAARVPTSGTASDVALAAEAEGAPWLAWTDRSGSWLMRFACR
jgi:hypothetical protein